MSREVREAIQRECGGLSVGESYRMPHIGCTSDRSKSLSVKRVQRGFVYHCFKCSSSGFVAGGVSTYTGAKGNPFSAGLTNAGSGGHAGTLCAPPPAERCKVSDGPTRIREWVEQYISLTEADDHGLYVHNLRLYVPLLGTGFQYRDFSPEWSGPKWVTKAEPKDRMFSVRCSTGSDSVCVTEDVLSSIVCGRYTDSYAVLGTSIPADVLCSIARQRYRRCFVFFDDDNHVVRKQQLRAKRQLELACSEVHVIHSAGRDPKELSDTELKRFLWSV